MVASLRKPRGRQARWDRGKEPVVWLGAASIPSSYSAGLAPPTQARGSLSVSQFP